MVEDLLLLIVLLPALLIWQHMDPSLPKFPRIPWRALATALRQPLTVILLGLGLVALAVQIANLQKFGLFATYAMVVNGEEIAHREKCHQRQRNIVEALAKDPQAPTHQWFCPSGGKIFFDKAHKINCTLHGSWVPEKP